MKYFSFISILLFLCCHSHFLQAQDSVEDHSFGERLALRIAIGNHTVGFPLQNQLKAVNPAISNLGLSCRLNRNKKHSILLGLGSSFIANEVIGNSFLLGLDLSYRYTFSGGLYTQVGIEMGALSQRSVRAAYSFPGPDATVTPIAQTLGTSYSGLVGYIGYQFQQDSLQKLSVFVSQRFFIQAPYFAVQAFDILPQNLLSIGINYQFCN
ncbi:MAG: hypothetical protein AAFP02_19150 [Bacteroidota bacterium]